VIYRLLKILENLTRVGEKEVRRNIARAHVILAMILSRNLKKTLIY
jgi:hypothetical protein